MKRALVVILLLIVLLALPLVYKDRSGSALVGPDLSELEYSAIEFDNGYEDLQLAGMLFLPEGEGPFPTVVIIHGSGTSFRNSVWYLSVTRHLQENGIAVLLPDKRGSEKSGGEWRGANFEELATDTLSAIDFVTSQDLFEYSSIGLVGMSQGGWIAPVVATKTDDLSFVVSMVGPSVTTDEQLLHEVTQDVAGYTYMPLAGLIAPFVVNGIKEKPHIAAYAGFDPIPYWKEVNVPVFFAFGENDLNVPVEASIDRLNENGLGHFKVVTYPDGGHAVKDARTNEVSGVYLQDLVRFIKEASP